jgi:hypothetical protein
VSPPGLWTLANLDFEHELAGAVRPLPQGVLERWRYLLRLLPGMAKAHCLPPQADLSLEPPVWQLLLWGVTPRTYALAQSLGIADQFPSPEVVRKVNHKGFSHQLERDLKIDLPGSAEVTTFGELERAVKNCPHDWVLKHPFGFSGRQRMLGKRGQLSESAAGWSRRQFSQAWSLVFEPWVYDRQDSSTHFHLHPTGQIEWIGFTRMLIDSSGVYRGTQVLPLGSSEPSLDCLLEVAARVASQGYFGPLGIDSFSGSFEGQPCNRPLVEINARYSFGRLALALRDWLPSDCSYVWHHPKQPLASPPPPLPLAAQVGSGLYGLPQVADPQGLSQTHLEVRRG